MSAAAETVIVRRDANGVILHYYPDRLGPHHVERKRHVSDRRRMALIAAEKEILTMAIIFDHLELSGIARTRLDDGLARIRRALSLQRPECGLAPEVVAA
jgi:hypothetical protein